VSTKAILLVGLYMAVVAVMTGAMIHAMLT
jgi:hypothetical protein